MGDEGRDLGALARPGAALCGARGRLLGEVEQRPLEQPVQALATRVDHPGLAQDGQQARRARHGPLGSLDRRAEHGLDVGISLRGRHGGRRRLADDRQDRALDRLGDGAVGRPRALGQGMRQVQAVEPRLAAERLGHAPEDLAGDDTRVAAWPHQRPEADGRPDPIGRLAGDEIRLLEGRADRGQHVRAGIAVGDGIDVERVDLLDVRLEVCDRGPEGLEQAWTIAGPSGHQATSVPLSARSRGPIDAGSGREDGWRRRRPG